MEEKNYGFRTMKLIETLVAKKDITVHFFSSVPFLLELAILLKRFTRGLTWTMAQTLDFAGPLPCDISVQTVSCVIGDPRNNDWCLTCQQCLGHCFSFPYFSLHENLIRVIRVIWFPTHCFCLENLSFACPGGYLHY